MIHMDYIIPSTLSREQSSKDKEQNNHVIQVWIQVALLNDSSDLQSLVHKLTVVDSSRAGSSLFCPSVFPLEYTNFFRRCRHSGEPCLTMWTWTWTLYMILSQPIRGWRSHLRSSCRLFYLSLPIQLIQPACVDSISLIRRKSRPLCSQPVTWKMRNTVLKQSVYLRLFSLIGARFVDSWHGPTPVLTCWLWWLHRSLPHSITYISIFPNVFMPPWHFLYFRKHVLQV